jgi:hypothetical protein
MGVATGVVAGFGFSFDGVVVATVVVVVATGRVVVEASGGFSMTARGSSAGAITGAGTKSDAPTRIAIRNVYASMARIKGRSGMPPLYPASNNRESLVQ